LRGRGHRGSVNTSISVAHPPSRRNAAWPATLSKRRPTISAQRKRDFVSVGRREHPVYDAVQMALADRLDARVLPFDRRLVRAFPERTLDARDA